MPVTGSPPSVAGISKATGGGSNLVWLSLKAVEARPISSGVWLSLKAMTVTLTPSGLTT